jgi:hypothetical protein
VDIFEPKSNPSRQPRTRKHHHIVRIEGPQVGAISGDQLAEHVFETDKRPRFADARPQRVRQRHSQQAMRSCMILLGRADDGLTVDLQDISQKLVRRTESRSGRAAAASRHARHTTTFLAALRHNRIDAPWLLNPIEQVFAKLKHLLRKTAARTVEAVCTQLVSSLAHSQECANYFGNSGYALT